MEHVPSLVSLSPTLMMLGGLVVAYYMYVVDQTAPSGSRDAFPALYRFLLNKWYFDELYDFHLRPAGLLRIGRLFWKGGDGAIIDGFGPDGISARVLDVTRGAVRLQTGYVYQYAFAMLLGVAALRDLVSVRRGSADVRFVDPLRPARPADPRVGCSSCCCPARVEATKRNARWIALVATLITFVAEPRRLGPLQSRASPASSWSRSTTGSRTPFSTSSASTACRCRSSC